MKTVLANGVLAFFSFWAICSLCAMAVLLFRAARDYYWRRRFTRAINRRYSVEAQPVIHLIRKSMDRP